MANIKSAKKRAVQAVKKSDRNLSRKTAVKTAIKKVVAAVEQGNIVLAQECFVAAQAKISRARSKGLFHRNTASRKISRLAQKIAAAQKTK